MSKTFLYCNTKYPNACDFNNIIFRIENIMLEDYNTISFNNRIFRIENIMLGDYNTISSKNYNRMTNHFRNNDMTGFNGKKYKVSSHIPMVHDTLSYFHLQKNMKATFNIPINASIDTCDLMLMRQIIDKKQRCDSLPYNSNKYGKAMTLSNRFEL